jgi:hypothetical protein
MVNFSSGLSPQSALSLFQNNNLSGLNQRQDNDPLTNAANRAASAQNTATNNILKTAASQSSVTFGGSVSAPTTPAPAVELGFEQGENGASEISDQLSQKLQGFFQPLGKQGAELADTVGNALNSLSNLVQQGTNQPSAFSINISFARFEQSFSNSANGSSGTVSGFAIEISIATASGDFDPNQSTILNSEGNDLGLSANEKAEGQQSGVYRQAAAPGTTLPAADNDQASQTQQILDFLKQTQQQISAFTQQEETNLRSQMSQALGGYSQLDVDV